MRSTDAVTTGDVGASARVDPHEFTLTAAHLITWERGAFSVRAMTDVEMTERATRDPTSCTLHLDCGAWQGDGEQAPLERPFGVVCGRTAALCEFTSDAEVVAVEGPDDEAGPINACLRALAGPQRRDVQVLRWLRSPMPIEPVAAGQRRTTRVFLPQMNLPLVPRMADLPANLIPDPTRLTCACHGPVMQRILYGVQAESQYVAVRCTIGRDPNQWFAMMAERSRSVAEDLARLTLRFERHARAWPAALVTLGPPCEIWAGFDLLFAATGAMAIVSPRVQEIAEERPWRGVLDAVLDTPARSALAHMARIAPSQLTWVGRDAASRIDTAWVEPHPTCLGGGAAEVVATVSPGDQAMVVRRHRRALRDEVIEAVEAYGSARLFRESPIASVFCWSSGERARLRHIVNA